MAWRTNYLRMEDDEDGVQYLILKYRAGDWVVYRPFGGESCWVLSLLVKIEGKRTPMALTWAPKFEPAKRLARALKDLKYEDKDEILRILDEHGLPRGLYGFPRGESSEIRSRQILGWRAGRNGNIPKAPLHLARIYADEEGKPVHFLDRMGRIVREVTPEEVKA